ncbi:MULTISPECIES: hypothetical protein [Shewanella]|uniref:Uncharacterized protein n=3 Tax=Shewanella putrefaciens TaxID=24 RepID=E6XL97_SHEP2|nr:MULTISPECIES: hypothetical protein [Shewanella]CAD6367269.1 hypothetical protein SHEWT2_02572 [Shewanella hafniensis]ABM26106.1 conserved hypothetical protein [Shewanella sp. W3-18-1]AVV83603.1 hypothetical protein SPWS13_1810 [Shewanella putrefaciens]MCA1898199.1 hypothetical protein [Shewanella putrefaciens]MCK7630395.1 hypothetical protein [Shewanella sp. JNE9-1]
MAKWLKWTINLAILSALIVACGVIYMQSVSNKAIIFNCSSELYDRHDNAEDDGKFYLLVDVLISAGNAQINYRYFHLDGTSAGMLLMQGEVKSMKPNSMTYNVSVKTKTESEDVAKKDWPEHMKYLSYISSLHFSESGRHNLSIEILDSDASQDYAVVLFQPSNTVCGCRIVNSRI